MKSHPNKTPKRYFCRLGFSLLEFVIVAGILSILAGLGAQAFSNFLSRQGMNVGIEHALALLQRARHYTLSSFDVVSGISARNYGIHVDAANDTFTLFFSTSTCQPFDSGGSNTVAVAEVLAKEVDIVSADFSGRPDVVFQRITGEAKAPNGAGTACVALNSNVGIVELRSRRSGEVEIIKVFSTGILEVQ